MNRKAALAAVLLAALAAAGCKQANYKMEELQNPDQDRRGMRDEHHLEDRVNINIPQGGTSPKDEYDSRQNIRPGDASGGRPPTQQGGNVIEQDSMRPSTVNPSVTK